MNISAPTSTFFRQASAVLLMAGLASTSYAAGPSGIRTFSGTDGLLNTFFNQCTSCHSSGGGTTPHWTSYTNVLNNHGGPNKVSPVNNTIYDRVFVDNDAPMYGGNAANTAHLEEWVADGEENYVNPYIGTGNSSGPTRDGTNSYQIDLSWSINDNGDEASYAVEYRLPNSASWIPGGTASDSAVTDGGDGSTNDDTATRTLSGLTCSNTDSYDYRVIGDNLASGTTTSSTRNFTIPCNTGATLSGSPGNATEDSAFSWTPTITSGSGGSDDLSFSFTGTPTGSLPRPAINSSTGQVTWTPVEGQTSSSFTIQVSDGDADTNITDTLFVTINVNPVVDELPVITASQQGNFTNQTEDVNSGFAYTVAFTDGDQNGDSWTWSKQGSWPSNVDLNTGTGEVEITSAFLEGTEGDHNITVRVTDSRGGSFYDEETYTITVDPDNENPVITTSTAAQAVDEDSLYSLDFNATDGDSISGNAASHVWSIESPMTPPDDMAIHPSTGVLTWTPTTEADLVQGVTVRVTDGLGGIDEETFNITVTAVNDNTPVITTVQGDLSGGTEDTPYTHQMIWNDDDVDGDSQSWDITATDDPDVSITTGGEIQWTPLNGELSATFTTRVRDSGLLEDTLELTINVSATNDAPIIDTAVLVNGNPVNQSPDGQLATQATDENSTITMDFGSTDPDAGDTVTHVWSIETPAVPLDDMSIDANGVFTWTPTSDVSITESIVIRVTDGGALNDEVSFDIDVTPVIDQTPVITTVQGDLATNTTEDTIPFSHTLTFTDGDLEGDGWTWSLTAQDDPQIAINPSSGEVTWAPVEGERGDFDFTARVTDDGAFFDEITLTITVLKDNEAPIIIGPIADQNATEDILFSYDVNFTDTDIGDTESWAILSPASPPDDMAISPTGVLSWTPGEGVDRTQSVTVQVTDEAAATDSISFDIIVDSVNDAPTIDAVVPTMMVEENSSITPYTMVVSDSDPQDNTPDLNSNLIFSIANITPTPNGAQPAIDANGEITWTPGNNDARTVDPAALSQDYTVTVSVADDGEDGQTAATQDFTITVTLQDGDTDTVPDYEDNCPVVSNTNQANNDMDSEGDLCDFDDDNDGVSDVAEDANPPMDPFLASDATGDVDGDSLDNLTEFTTCTGGDVSSADTCPAISIDSVGPTITHNGDQDLVAQGYTTYVDFFASAIDGNDGPVEVIIVGTAENDLRPGDHVVNWQAQDQIPNVTDEVQNITIHPLVSLGGSQVIVEGGSGQVVIEFNGDIPAADYPVSISYVVSGTASLADYSIDRASPIVISNPGDLSDNTITLNVDIHDGDAAEGVETLNISLGTVSTGPELGSSITHQIAIAEGQVPPVADLSSVQGGTETQIIFGGLGNVTVTANATDGNGDLLTYDWSGSDTELAGASGGNTFVFDADALTVAPEDLPRLFNVSVTISDGLSLITESITLSYQASSFSLSSGDDSDGDGTADDTEGLTDSDGDGIPDYLDAHDNPPNLLFISNSDDEFIEAEPGHTLSLGGLSIGNEGEASFNSTGLEELGVNINDEGFIHFGVLYDFVIDGLSAVDSSTFIVVPLPQNVPPNSVIRIFDGDEWYTFIEDGQNAISSASSGENGCPAPGHQSFEPGLLAFRDCIQLQLSDGGPNDTDSNANGSIQITAGLALAESLFEDPDDPDDPEVNSAGSINPLSHLFLLSCLMLSLVQTRRLNALK